MLAALHAEERRLRDVEVAVLDELREVAVEERQQQRADVRAVDVGVGHDDDAVVAQLREVVVFACRCRAERRDQERDLLRREHLVEARLLDVQDLAVERQDRLDLPVAALLGRAAGRLALDDVELATAPDRAPGSRRACRAASRRRARPCGAPGRAPCAPPRARAPRRAPSRRSACATGGMLLEVDAELLVHERLDDALHLAVAELRLRLPLELRLGNLHADDRGQAFADVVALEALVVLLQRGCSPTA